MAPISTSIFLARLLAVSCLALGLGALFNKNYFHRAVAEIVGSPALDYLGGLMSLWVGYWIVSIHNVWVADWAVLVTLMGWIALLRGVTTLVFPQWSAKVAGKFKVHHVGLITVVCLLMGLVLGYFSFVQGYFHFIA